MHKIAQQKFKAKYGPYALVAGASEGLGAAYAEALAKRSLNMVLLARRKEKLEDLATRLHANYGVEVICRQVNLADWETTKQIIENLDVQIGLLVYNAAYCPIELFEVLTEEQLTEVVLVNVNSPMLLSRLLIGKMLPRKRGGIVLMSSLAGTQGSPKLTAYAASKSFNAILAEGLWAELRGKGIDVIASVAGAIATPGYTQAQGDKAPGTLKAEQVAETTLNALGKTPISVPGGINKIARFLMSRLLSRKMAIKLMSNNTKSLS